MLLLPDGIYALAAAIQTRSYFPLTVRPLSMQSLASSALNQQWFKKKESNIDNAENYRVINGLHC